MAIDIDKVIAALDEARSGFDNARDAGTEWKRGKVEGVNYTVTQNQAIKTAFMVGLQKGKDGIAAVEAELAK